MAAATDKDPVHDEEADDDSVEAFYVIDPRRLNIVFGPTYVILTAALAFIGPVRIEVLLGGLFLTVGNVFLSTLSQRAASKRRFQSYEAIRAFGIIFPFELFMIYVMGDEFAVWVICLPTILGCGVMWHGWARVGVYAVQFSAIVAMLAATHTSVAEIAAFAGFFALASGFSVRVSGMVRQYVANQKRLTDLLKQEKTLVQAAHAKITESSARWEHLASVDPLTGASNRRGLSQILQAGFQNTDEMSGPFTALLVDCDDFKAVNSTFGHAVGDAVLTEVVARLNATLPETAFLARVGGDEFLAVLPGMSRSVGLEVAERVRMTIASTPFAVGTDILSLTVSIGAEELKGGVDSVEQLMTATRFALGESKASGKNIVCFPEALAKSGPSRHQLLRSFEAGEGLYAVAQPILVEGRTEPVGFEMFARRRATSYQLPQDFFPEAANHGILAVVDVRCAKICVAEARRRELKGRVHVNLFPSTLVELGVQDVVSLFEPRDQDVTYCIEFNEQLSQVGLDAIAGDIEAIRAAGISIAVDDVGFGKTSLEMLLELKPDVLKIDRGVLRRTTADSEPQIQKLLTMLSPLDADLVIEGIESAEDLALVQGCGGEFYQGYYWGQPA